MQMKKKDTAGISDSILKANVISKNTKQESIRKYPTRCYEDKSINSYTVINNQILCKLNIDLQIFQFNYIMKMS